MRRKNPICPRCKVRPKAGQCSYCNPCNTAYQAYRRKVTGRKPWRDPDHKAPHKRKLLGIKDTPEPADPNSVPWTGWQIDRHAKQSYAFNQRNGSDDSTVYYLIGHYAMTRFWHQMNDTAWSQGPDNEEFIDGSSSRLSQLKGRRYYVRGPGVPIGTKR